MMTSDEVMTLPDNAHVTELHLAQPIEEKLLDHGIQRVAVLVAVPFRMLREGTNLDDQDFIDINQALQSYGLALLEDSESKWSRGVPRPMPSAGFDTGLEMY
ncbi:MAG: hypothetical protein JWN75_274 [Candidatus Saccharibacteria bacterium]|nr:hypothetical protein [Candidatus Saccharibacteria bacterium]